MQKVKLMKGDIKKEDNIKEEGIIKKEDETMKKAI